MHAEVYEKIKLPGYGKGGKDEVILYLGKAPELIVSVSETLSEDTALPDGGKGHVDLPVQPRGIEIGEYERCDALHPVALAEEKTECRHDEKGTEGYDVPQLIASGKKEHQGREQE